MVIVGIPMGTNCAPLVADLFLFCYERDFMLSLSDNNQSDVIEAFNSHCLVSISILSRQNNDFDFNSFQKFNFSKVFPFKCIRKLI